VLAEGNFNWEAENGTGIPLLISCNLYSLIGKILLCRDSSSSLDKDSNYINMKKILIIIITLLLASCSVMNTNVMIGATSEYEDHVWYYEQNQEYHRQYDLKLIIKQKNTSISCDNLFYKEL
jgi:hypothetical protein